MEQGMSVISKSKYWKSGPESSAGSKSKLSATDQVPPWLVSKLDGVVGRQSTLLELVELEAADVAEDQIGCSQGCGVHTGIPLEETAEQCRFTKLHRVEGTSRIGVELPACGSE